MRFFAGKAAAALVALAPTVGAQPALAADEAPEIHEGTIWTGTIGTLPITACFDEQFSSAGTYYYNAHLIPLRLVEAEGDNPLVLNEVEGFDTSNGSSWTITSRTDTRIAATWRKGNRSYPIRLTAVPVTYGEYGTACESAEYIEPLLTGGTISEERARFEGVEYTALTYNGPDRLGEGDYVVGSFALDPVQPGDAGVNRLLAEALPDGTVEHEMGQCVAMSMPGGQLGYLTETIAPAHISDRWLGVDNAGSSYCGGAHPGHNVTLAVYDRASGEQADPSTWFRPKALQFYEYESPEYWNGKRPIAYLSPPLLDIVLARWPDYDDAADCKAAAGEGSGWEIGLASEGVSFVRQFAHVIFACTETVVVPWDALEPYLSDEGRAVRASL